jgi:CubicO group peptidase (beta-lactamase class C family)
MTQVRALDSSTGPTPEVEKLREFVVRRCRELSVPGAAVGLVWRGQEDVVTTGVASTASGAAVTPDTLFMVGSTTKTVTATALLSLVDAGRLDLDAPVLDHLPDLVLADPGATGALTLRHLLTHTGGFEGDVEDDDLWGPSALADCIATYASLPQHAAPGAAFSYSNAGLRLAGRLLEVAAGTSYEQAVHDLALAPLGMTESFFLPWEVWSRPHAVGHVVDEDGGATVAHTWGMGRSAAPEGGLVSSVADQVRFARYHLDGSCPGPAPLAERTRLAMQAEQLPAAPPFDAVGLPWLLVDTHGERAVTHGGNIAGVQLSSLLLLPGHGLAVTTLTNAAPGRQLGVEVADWCLENLAGLTAAPPLESSRAPEHVLEAYAGRYDSGVWGMDVEVVDGGLVASFTFNSPPTAEEAVLPPPQRMELCAPDAVVRPAAPGEVFGRFQRDTGGAVVRLLCQGRALHRRP